MSDFGILQLKKYGDFKAILSLEDVIINADNLGMDACHCCGAEAFVNLAEDKYKSLDLNRHPGIVIAPGIHGEEKRRGKRRTYHVETSNGPLTVDVVTSFNLKELKERGDDWF